jgi:[protein-PII] uridylyltransferase
VGIDPSAPPIEGHASAAIALVATGGYGRQEVCPFSDIDVTICYLPGIRGIKEISSAIFYPLWDSGIRLGHSVRTPKEAVGVASSEIDVAVSHLDARKIAGLEETYLDLSDRMSSLVRRRSRRILDDIVDKQKRRLDSLGDFDGLKYKAGYLKADLKLGSGGLRDICVLEWSAKCLGTDVAELMSRDDARALREAKSDLLLARSALHLCYGRQHDILDIEAVARLEGRFGDSFADRLIRRALAATVTVEVISRKALAVIASQVGRTGLAASLMGRGVSSKSDKPEKLANKASIPPKTTHEAKPQGPAPAALVKALSGPLDDLLSSLEELQVDGFIQEAIPEWRNIEGLYQKDPFHTFSVDVHSMATASRVLHGLQRAVLDSPGIWPSRLLDELTALAEGRCGDRSTSLRLACLLHDIGKGSAKDTVLEDVDESHLTHSDVGAETAFAVASDLGFGRHLSEECAFLVRHHLLLAEFASRRDIRDAATVEAVANIVGDKELLDELYLLTLADASATGPQAWNSWRRSLITQLYLACRHYLDRELESPEGVPVSSPEGPRQGFADVLAASEIPERDVSSIVQAAPRSLIESRAESLRLVAQALRRYIQASRTCAVEFVELGDGFYEMAVAANDSPGLFAKIAGVISLSGLSVVSARAHTLNLDNPIALDLFSVQAPPHRSFSDEDRVIIEERLRAAASGKIALNYRLALKTREWKRQIDSKSERAGTVGNHRIAPSVHIDNECSRDYTVIEIQAGNRPRLLYDVASTLAELGLDIESAKISTMADTAADVFYVTDSRGQKISDADHIKEVREALAYSLSAGL